MKSVILWIFMFCCVLVANAQDNIQDIQLMYDSENACYVSTVESYVVDKYGSTCIFIDTEYAPNVISTYWELTREWCFWPNSKWSCLSINMEYGGGMDVFSGSYNNSFLGGLTYTGYAKDYSIFWSLSTLYKAIPGLKDAQGKSQMHNFQITGNYDFRLAQGWVSLCGFFDFWREVRPEQGTSHIFYTEPQCWLNLNKIKALEHCGLSLGGEIKMSHNFVHKGFDARPAFGAKWTF